MSPLPLQGLAVVRGAAGPVQRARKLTRCTSPRPVLHHPAPHPHVPRGRLPPPPPGPGRRATWEAGSSRRGSARAISVGGPTGLLLRPEAEPAPPQQERPPEVLCSVLGPCARTRQRGHVTVPPPQRGPPAQGRSFWRRRWALCGYRHLPTPRITHFFELHASRSHPRPSAGLLHSPLPVWYTPRPPPLPPCSARNSARGAASCPLRPPTVSCDSL